MPRTRIIASDQAAGLVQDGDVVAVSGVMVNLVPEELCAALERRFLATGAPRDLTEYHLNIYGLMPGTGLDHFAHRGLTRRMIGSSFPAYPWAAESPTTRMIIDGELEAIALPAGAIAECLHARGAGRTDAVLRLGLGTFVDPRVGNARVGSIDSGEPWVEVAGDDALRYRAPNIDVSFLLGSKADPDGNVSFENEPLHQSAVAQALATRASGGIVIVQVRELVAAGSLDPRLVALPAFLTDYIVVVPDQRSFAYGLTEDDSAFVTGGGTPREVERPPWQADTIIAARATREIVAGNVVNMGAGLPVKYMPAELERSGLADEIDILIDHGSLGGTNLGGVLAATHWNPSARIDSNQVYTYLAGTGLDVAFLGAAEIDGRGNVNVARADGVVPGIGGFIDIAESARTLVFCTTLRRGGLEVAINDGQLEVVREGRTAKFVSEVELVCFDASRALRRGQRVRYLTERAVFELSEDGLVMIEVAPGIEPAAVRAAMGCEFIVAPNCRPMPLATRTATAH